MNEINLCPKCGQQVPIGAPEGLCPRCLGALNLEAETGNAAEGNRPPTAEELAPRFPQLEILEVLGQGGMGVVYKVRQKELDRIAALKILPPGTGSDAAFAERFAREAKALARLNHPGIVTIFDSGRADGLFYFLMEFVDGVSLRQLMRTGRISAREALAIVPQICDALQYAHDHGIVHRDIKPENILLDRKGRVKVADFGLVKLIGAGSEPHPSGNAGTAAHDDLTKAGKVMGTPSYMAPEQAERPGEVDHRADIYALGVVFYQMLTGELPGQFLEAPSHKVQVDVRLDEIVLRALEKEPDRRYQKVSQVKTAVETILQMAPPLISRAPAPQRSRARFAYAAGAAVVLLCALGILYWPHLANPVGHLPKTISDGETSVELKTVNDETGEASKFLTQGADASVKNSSGTNAPEPAPPKSAEDVLARYSQARAGFEAFKATLTLEAKGSFESRDGLGSFGPLKAKGIFKAPNKWMMLLRSRKGVEFERAFDGNTGWEVWQGGPPQTTDPVFVLVDAVAFQLYCSPQLPSAFQNLTLKGKETILGHEAYVLESAGPQGPPARFWFESRSGLLIRIETSIGGAADQIDFDDYRDVDGLKFPFLVRMTGADNDTLKFEETIRNGQIDDSQFRRPTSAGIH